CGTGRSRSPTPLRRLSRSRPTGSLPATRRTSTSGAITTARMVPSGPTPRALDEVEPLTRRGGDEASEARFTLVEALVAAIIAVLAVVGLAHTFGLGRAFINRFEVARAALGAAQERLELLQITPRTSADFSPDSLHVRPFSHSGRDVGT